MTIRGELIDEMLKDYDQPQDNQERSSVTLVPILLRDKLALSFYMTE